MTRQNVLVTVMSAEKYDDAYPFSHCSKLAYVAEWFAMKLREIPEEYRALAECDIGSISGYEGSHYASIEITYSRPETDDEMNKRLTKESAAKDSIRQNELAILAELTAKYADAL